MEITKKALIDLIKKIDSGIEEMSNKLQKQEQEIKDMQLQNQSLKENNRATLEQIKEYIKELEKIRSHYVDSNNQSKQ
jgi:predicted DNA-binding protein YlxM (UPF0122 family)